MGRQEVVFVSVVEERCEEGADLQPPAEMAKAIANRIRALERSEV